ncbi:putative acetyltransferase NATA1-like [Hordeum vulgare]|nr:putative acetyltransferase NATA1-like [Hordeum vulgare]
MKPEFAGSGGDGGDGAVVVMPVRTVVMVVTHRRGPPGAVVVVVAGVGEGGRQMVVRGMAGRAGPLRLLHGPHPRPLPSPVPASADTVGSRRLDLSASPLADPEAAAFPSPRGGGRVTAGFVICFPNYSTFLAKPGLYVEDIFVRAPWRRRGLGRMMLSAVAGRAAEIGMGRVEWCVLDWNQNAIDFYEGMGAEVFKQWRICRLTAPRSTSTRAPAAARVRRRTPAGRPSRPVGVERSGLRRLVIIIRRWILPPLGGDAFLVATITDLVH